MSSKSNKEEPKVKKTITSQRNTQVVISKKISVKEGDIIEYEYNKEDGKIIDVTLYINEEKICNLFLEELDEFLELFYQVPM